LIPLTQVKSTEDALSKLKDIQLRLKAEGRKWWRRDELRREALFRDALQRGARPVMRTGAFTAALETIRTGHAVGWGYVKSGNESAYFLHELADALPEQFQPTQEELDLSAPSDLRAHALMVIDSALELHRMMMRGPPAQGPPGREDAPTQPSDVEWRRAQAEALNVYLTHLLTLVTQGKMPLPAELMPAEGLARAAVSAQVAWLLDLRVHLTNGSIAV
jgi:hypothetical protein